MFQNHQGHLICFEVIAPVPLPSCVISTLTWMISEHPSRKTGGGELADVALRKLVIIAEIKQCEKSQWRAKCVWIGSRLKHIGWKTEPALLYYKQLVWAQGAELACPKGLSHHQSFSGQEVWKLLDFKSIFLRFSRGHRSHEFCSLMKWLMFIHPRECFRQNKALVNWSLTYHNLLINIFSFALALMGSKGITSTLTCWD